MGFEPTICGVSPNGSTQIDWYKFDGYLGQSFHERTQREYRVNARQYWQVLTTGDASGLLGLSDSKRMHAMAGLSALANFLGLKSRWKQTVEKYGLKWSGNNDLGDLVELLYANRFDEMLHELRAALETIPADYGNYFRFNLATGLRPAEAVTSANMLRAKSEPYYNQEYGTIEHFRYPKIFLRNKKKCFLSVVDSETVDLARTTRGLDYQGIRSEFRRRHKPWLMRYCRKLFATYMGKHVGQELTDLLEGRTPASIFSRFYNRPNYLDELQKVRSCLPELRRLLD